MIWITRLNQKSIVLNADLIEHIESTPDTVITLTNGQKITALESPENLIGLVRDYRRSLCNVTVIERGSE